MVKKSINLKKKLTELRKSIKENSTDKVLAGKLTAELLSVKGQLSVSPLPIGEVGKELGSFKGKTFCITKYEDAVIYHVYNSFDYVVRPNMVSLYETLVDYVDRQEEYGKLEGEEKDMFDLNLSALAYVMSLPTFAFSDAEFLFNIATEVVTYLRKKSELLLEQPLQEETPELNESFKEASLAVEELKNLSE